MKHGKFFLITLISVFLFACTCPFSVLPGQIVERLTASEKADTFEQSASQTPAAKPIATPTMEPTATATVMNEDSSTSVYRGNLERTGVYPGSGPKDAPNLLWKFDTAGVIHWSSPAIDAGVAYIGSETGMFAVETQTGQQVWHYETAGSVHTSPSIANGVLYFGSADGAVHALETTSGEPLWTFTTGYEVRSSPLIVEDRVYFGCDDGFLYALNAQTGQEAWRFEVDGEVDSLMGFYKAVCTAPALANNSIVFGNTQIGGYNADLKVYALDLITGQQLWEHEPGFLTVSPAVYENVVYVGGYKNFIGLDVKTGSLTFQSSPDGNTSSPAIFDGMAYFGCENGQVHALNLNTGEEAWVFDPGRSIAIDTAPSIADGVVYAGGGDGFMYALDLYTGQLLWEFTTGGWIASSPVISAGVLYFGSADGYLYALK